ncbi:MAG: adenylate/guanylate cyclase domain-containing protein [Bacteroidetes bacterium]|nr:MAG: adenylate/guanylate cyclase domain-containing protein [Bacteroidota bacterium]
MPLTYRQRRRLEDTLWSVLFFIIGVNLYSMIRFWEAEGYPASELLADAITATIGGLLGGLLLPQIHAQIWGRTGHRRPFGLLILWATLTDLLLIVSIFVPVTTASGVWFFERSWADSLAYNLDYMTTLPFLGLVIYLLMLSALYNFVWQVSKKFGRGVLRGMLLGRYHQPRETERIVMFLDLKGSTTIAEQLGHIRYSRLIQDCFFDLNLMLLPYEAQIYKYVGDEAILSWSLAAGTRRANCLAIYYGFHQRLERRRAWYEAEYGLLPTFKAGLNAGPITVAEVGDDRREIEFHGDVLNTAARIQGQCNALGKSLLLSRHLWGLLGEAEGFALEPIGTIELKGKTQKVPIFACELREDRSYDPGLAKEFSQ